MPKLSKKAFYAILNQLSKPHLSEAEMNFCLQQVGINPKDFHRRYDLVELRRVGINIGIEKGASFAPPLLEDNEFDEELRPASGNQFLETRPRRRKNRSK